MTNKEITQIIVGGIILVQVLIGSVIGWMWLANSVLGLNLH
jgi:hypothetical protein